jgi:hypothetical protein
MIIVDMGGLFPSTMCTTELQKDVYTMLTEELIDNQYDEISMWQHRRKYLEMMSLKFLHK